MPPRETTIAAYDLIIFDLDGTLVDTAPEIADSINAYLERRGLLPASFAEVRGWIGHGARPLLQQALASRTAIADEELASEMEVFGEIYRSCCGSNSRAYDGVLETLGALRTHGKRLALMTNKESRFALPVLAAHRLTDYFDDIVCGDTLAARKPDPLPVRHCMAQAGVSASQTLVIGDSAIDVATARAAGVAVWVVPWGYDGGETAATGDRTINSFGDLAVELVNLGDPAGAAVPHGWPLGVSEKGFDGSEP